MNQALIDYIVTSDNEFIIKGFRNIKDCSQIRESYGPDVESLYFLDVPHYAATSVGFSITFKYRKDSADVFSVGDRLSATEFADITNVLKSASKRLKRIIQDVKQHKIKTIKI